LHKSEVTCIKLSHDGNFVASGDSTKNVFIWKSSTKEIVNNRFVFHSAKVFEIDWSSDDTNLVSASLDRSVIVWDLPSKSKVKVFSDVDVEVVTAVTFVNDKEFICGGHSCGLRRFMF
jgi:WD40 repeat protein